MAEQKPLLPPFFFMTATAAMVLLNFVLPLGRLQPLDRLIGLVPLVLGVAVVVAADQQFKRKGTTVKPFQPVSALVTGGVYRLTRNPMYLSMVLILVAFALFMNHIGPLLVIPVFVWIIHRRFIAAEEQHLEEAFGDSYRTYRGRVRRWI